MLRPRPISYVVGAILVLLSLYALLSLSRASDPSAIKTPGYPGSSNNIDPNKGHGYSDHTTAEDDADSTAKHTGPPDTEEKVEDNNTHPTAPKPTSKPKPVTHVVDDLMKAADDRFEEILSRETHTLEDAAAAYRLRRGRHPPPGFDLWYKYAKDNEAIVVEDFWDQVYHDLEPFWAIEPAMIRTQARRLDMGASIRGGSVNETAKWFWHEIWGKMIDTFAEHLPDMFIPMNPMDESRLLVRWENMTEYMKKVHREKSIPKASNVIRTVKGWDIKGKDADVIAPDEKWNGFNPYNYARRACPPNSPARQVSGVLSPDQIVGYHNVPHPKVDVKRYFEEDFVKNYTEASDFCSDATIGGLHGALMLPLTCSNSDVLMPMFGGSKFHVNNEILLPAPMYWNGEERFGGTGGDPTPWKQKQNTVVWRGTATGGRSKPFTWYMFHRHRFVAMTNGTRYQHADKNGHDLIFNQFLQETGIKTLRPQIQQNLGAWLKSTHDVAFTDLVCDELESDGSCWYTKDEYEQVLGIQFAEQFITKYLPDIDGNSFSGRYRAFLLSNSLPIKATIYREWHDSRLLAWKHFVPMNNRFSDYYRIMEYFLGDVGRGIGGRDDEAEKIATEGRKWGEKVLRKVDMQIYVFRVLLEYARITDDNRLKVGWVDDLIGSLKTSSNSKTDEPGA